MASQLGLASGSVPGLEPESALASGSVPGLEPESVPVWEQDSDSVPVWEQDSDSVPGLEPESALASVMPMASQALESAWVPGLASGSVPGLEPESVPVWEQDSDSVPGLEPESALASGRRDRTRHRRQIPSALSWR